MSNTLRIGGLKIVVLDYQYPDKTDKWDGNWLEIEASHSDGTRDFLLHDNCVRTDELARLADDLAKLLVGDATVAELPTMEPYLKIKIAAEKGADTLHGTMRRRTELYEFEERIERNRTSQLLRDLHSVLEAYPVRGISHA